jgi:prolipoprotein diacylglyceryl transferase
VLWSIPSPPANGFHIGPLFIHAYGLAYVVAVTAAVILVRRRWQTVGGDRELVYDVALWGFPAGIVGGRIYFLITSWNQVPPHWWGAFAVWDGGLGIWGGITLGSLVGLWRVHRAGASMTLFMDAGAPGLLVAQAIGRVGNYFNQELYGKPSSLPWALQINVAHRYSGYLQYSTFEPMFLYELLFDLLLAGFLIWLGRGGRIRPPGLFALYVAGYSGYRIFEETQRIDPSHYLWGMRLNFWVSCVLTAIGASWFAWTQRPSARARPLPSGASRRTPQPRDVGAVGAD